VWHLFIDKEVYPTVGINMHCNVIGWVNHVGSIFSGTHNDKTTVRFDDLAQSMRKDPLFTQCKWDTTVTSSPGVTCTFQGRMTMCDSGYHRWTQTMCGMKYPTTANQTHFSSRFYTVYFIIMYYSIVFYTLLTARSFCSNITPISCS
jgi:hypothetical protein